MERYRVSGKQPVVDAITAALEASGAEILKAPDHRSAPFEYRARMKDGEVLDLVCYAFLANRYQQSGRPPDEHRFQIKYGSDFGRYFKIYRDPRGRKVTLLLGVHLEEKIFVAIDPAANNPTWFSKSFEFKDREIRAIKEKGWHCWERQRSAGRRKESMPLLSFTTESVLGFTAKNFARYVEVERATTGMEPSERIGIAEAHRPGRRAAHPGIVHSLEEALGLPAADILEMISKQRRVLMNVRGSIAEVHLERYLRGIKELTRVDHPDRDRPPDFEVQYRRMKLGVECKNLLRSSKRAKVDFQRTRAPKGNPCGRYYAHGKFDVLAACMEARTKRWEFQFCPTYALRPHKTCEGRISQHAYLDEVEEWTSDVREALDRAMSRRGRRKQR